MPIVDTPLFSQQTEHDQSPILAVLVAVRPLLIRAVILFGVCFVVCWNFREELTLFVKAPLVSAFPAYGSDTILLRVIDAFMLHLALCMYVSLMVLIPYLTFDAWRIVGRRFGQSGLTLFITPAAMSLFFLAGAAFAFLWAMPVAFKFLVMYSMDGGGVLFDAGAESTAMDFLQISLREHVSFSMKIAIAIGLSFETPLLMLGLARTGIVGLETFTSGRAWAFLGLAVVASLMTPPDPWSMLLLLGPLYLLYEFGILLVRLFASGVKTRR